MAVKPNFKDTAHLDDGKLKVRGRTGDGPSPLLLQVVIEQDATAQGDFLDLVPHDWEVHLQAGDFVPGPAVAFGIETHAFPLHAAVWTQAITII